MGLDSVELLVEVEKTFNIQIANSEAEKIRTVGDFYNVVWNHLSQRQSNRCNSQILFYKLRNNFSNILKIRKESFTPHSSLHKIFPAQNRRKIYYDFEKIIDLKLPPLVLTKQWKTFLERLGLIAIGGSLLSAGFFWFFLNYKLWIFIIPVATILIFFLFSESLNSKRIIIDPDDVRSFTEKTLALNFNSLTKDAGVNRREVEHVINQIIVDKIGVDWEEISPEKSLTDDLGID